MTDDQFIEKIRRDIAKFRRTGELPKDNDVKEGGASYWEWVEMKKGGMEPAVNRPDDLEGPPETDERRLSPAERLREVMRGGLKGLSALEKRVFDLCFRQERPEAEAAAILKTDQPHVNRIKARIRRKIAVAINLQEEEGGGHT